jgi:5-methyltetrahydrofolate--homocysteine methyltransferase
MHEPSDMSPHRNTDAWLPRTAAGPVIVGERTSTLGSSVFHALIEVGDLAGAAAVGLAQVAAGARLLDVCLVDPDRDERADMIAFLDVLRTRIEVPLLIDSSDADVLEAAFSRWAGRCVVNSVNLRSGEEHLGRVAALLREYGGAVVVGCLDEEGMAFEAGRKLEVARRSAALLTGSLGIPGEVLIFDPLVFPIGAGPPQSGAAARQTLEGVGRIRQDLPEARTILGVSNVSWGLPPAVRNIIDTVFLDLARGYGLTLAITDPERVTAGDGIGSEERQLAEEALFETRPGALRDLLERTGGR